MALQQVKSTFLHREKRILVAIDEAARKMENLSMICTLCHHFTCAAVPPSSRACLLENINMVLGMEAADVFQNLVSSQKSYNKHFGYSWPCECQDAEMSLALPTRSDIVKSDMVARLRKRRDKCKFIRNVMNAVKNSDTIIPNRRSVDDCKHFSVVTLLKTALQSKYRDHVRRCIKELDVESLLNILYLLVMPSASPECSSVTNSFLYDGPEMSPLSSITVKDLTLGQQIESFYRIDSPVSASSADSSKQSIFWDDDETVVGFAEDGKELSPERREAHKTATSLWKDCCKIRMSKIIEMEDAFRRLYSTFALPQGFESTISFDDMELSHLNVTEWYDKFSTIVSKEQLRRFMREFIAQDNRSEECYFRRNTESLLDTLHSFRSLVSSIFINHQSYNGAQTVDRISIDLKLLSIEEKKIKKVLTRVTEKHEISHNRLSSDVTAWQSRVEEVRCQINQQLRKSIKEHVAADISIGKSRENEMATFRRDLVRVNDSLSKTRGFVKQSVKSLRARRHYLEASLEALIRDYEATMRKYQAKINELCVEETANNKHIEKLQNKFKDVEEKYDEMKAMQRLKQLLANMEKAEAIKQNWAARKIQIAWRKYKVAKLRKKKLKGRKKGKKKTPPPPGKGTSPPTKSSTPGSRSKSQTP